VKFYSSLSEVQNDLRGKSLSIPALVDYYLSAIENKKHLNAFLEVWPEEARLRAAEIQQKWDNGTAANSREW